MECIPFRQIVLETVNVKWNLESYFTSYTVQYMSLLEKSKHKRTKEVCIVDKEI